MPERPNAATAPPVGSTWSHRDRSRPRTVEVTSVHAPDDGAPQYVYMINTETGYRSRTRQDQFYARYSHVAEA